MYDNCGALQDTIQILRAQPGQDAQGNATTTWALIAETKAQARDLSGREFFANANHQAENVMNFKIRWRTGLTTGMRISDAGARYDIIQVNHLNNRRGGYMLLRARMIQGEGAAYGNL